MKKTILTVSVVVVSAFLIAHAVEDKLPGPNAAEFWTYITETSPYTEWKFWEDH